MKTTTAGAPFAAWLLASFTVGCASMTGTRTSSEGQVMEQKVYTLGVWHVREGRGPEFIEAWQELGAIFASLPHPPSGKGVLVQSVTQPTLYYSFGPWDSLDHIAAMREDPRAQEGLAKLLELCTEATPGAFRVIAESP